MTDDNEIQFFARQTNPEGSDSKFDRFFQKINRFFKQEQVEVDQKLNGRIHELQESADQYLLRLIEFKHEFERTLEPYFFSILCNIIDPLIKEINQIQKTREHHGAVAQQVKVFHRYAQWIEKTKKWIELEGQQLNHDSLHKEVINHLSEEFIALIDRDSQLIDDYLHQLLSHLSSDVTENSEFHAELQCELTPFLIKLNQLKECPQNLSLESLIQWRKEKNHAREAIFTESLHAIDSLAERHKGEALTEEDHSEHVLELILKLSTLEEEVIQLTTLIANMEEGNEITKKSYINLLEKLDDEAHCINSDLLLPSELFSRTEKIIESIQSLQNDLSF